TGECAHEKGARVKDTRCPSVCAHCLFDTLLQRAYGVPVAEELLEHQASNDAVQPVVWGELVGDLCVGNRVVPRFVEPTTGDGWRHREEVHIRLVIRVLDHVDQPEPPAVHLSASA